MERPDHRLPVIVVLGATGQQGRGVVRAILSKPSPTFHVRAVTRNPQGPAALRLLEEYEGTGKFSIVRGDVYDEDSIRGVFEGAYGVFAVTANRIAGELIDSEEKMKHELQAGRNIVNAAKDRGIQHFVFSSLPNLSAASNGRFTKVYHFDYKHDIEQYAREQLPAVTALMPGLFYPNLLTPQYCRREGDGQVRFCAPVPGETLADWVDPSYDIGVFACETFILGPEKTKSKQYPVVGPKIRFDELSRIFSEHTSRPSRFDPTTIEEWGATIAKAVGEGFKEDIEQMMEWISIAPKEKICYGTLDPSEDLSWGDLGVRASTFEEWLERSKWSGP